MKTLITLPSVAAAWSLAGTFLLSMLVLAGSVSGENHQSANASGDNAAVPTTVTLSVQNMDLTELLAMFSSSRNVNIVSLGDVRGKVSVDLHDVPFDHAMEAIVGMAGYQVTKKSGIYFIGKAADGDVESTILRDTRTFRLSYADPEELLPVLGEMTSSSGKVTSYGALRTIIAEDRPSVLSKIDYVIRALDVAPRQVLIEAKIIEIRLSKDLRFGVDWSLLFSQGAGSGRIDVEGFTTPSSAAPQGMFVSWREGDFISAIETLEGIERLRTLAAPQVLAVDGTEAEIIIGGELGFSVVTTIDNTVIQSVEFLDTGAQLRITPTIADDGYVLMSIHPELSDGVIDEGLPSKSTTEVTSQVLVKDGHTLFIGGLIKEREETQRSGIPLLVEIPVLGALFGKTTVSNQRSELITLITPRILKPGEQAPYEPINSSLESEFE